MFLIEILMSTSENCSKSNTEYRLSKCLSTIEFSLSEACRRLTLISPRNACMCVYSCLLALLQGEFVCVCRVRMMKGTSF